MKIYTEVIMEWDEDKEQLVEISSESYEHEGDIALCFSNQGHKLDMSQKKASPGFQAAGLPGGRFPTQVPSTWAGLLPGSIHTGQYDPIGVGLPGPTPVDVELSKAKKKRWHGMSYKRTPGAFYDDVERYSKQFKSKWYNPYLEATMKMPMEGIRAKGFEELTPQMTHLTQQAIDAIPGIGDLGQAVDYDWSGKKIAPIGVASGLREDFRTLRGAERAKDIAIAGYEAEIEDKEKSMETAEEERLKLRREISRERAGLAGGVLGAEEAIRAGGAFSGIETHGPQEEFIRAERGGGQEGFFQAADKLRKTEADYTTTIEGLESEIDRLEGVEGIAGEEAAFETAREDYGAGVGQTLAQGQAAIDELMASATSLTSAHQGFSQQLAQQIRNPHGWGGYENIADITGYGGHSAPTEGWFGDAPYFNPTRNLLSQAETQAKYLRDAYTGDLASLAPETTDY